MLEDLILKDETKKECEIFISMKKEFCSHLDTLQTSFQGYFTCNLDSLKSEAWIRNPFLIDLNGINDEDPNKEELIDLRASELLKIEFNAKTLEEFWCSQQQSYQSLEKQAIRSMIPFATTYLCEAGFSALVTMKTKHRNRMGVQHDMRVALSKTHPQFSDLVQKNTTTGFPLNLFASLLFVCFQYNVPVTYLFKIVFLMILECIILCLSNFLILFDYKIAFKR